MGTLADPETDPITPGVAADAPAPDWPIYVAPADNNLHSVFANGGIHQLPYDALTDHLKMQAHDYAANPPSMPDLPASNNEPGAGPALFQSGFRQLNRLHDTIGSVPVGEQTTDAINSITADQPSEESANQAAKLGAKPAGGPQEDTGPVAKSTDDLQGAEGKGKGAGGVGGAGGAQGKLDDAEKLAETAATGQADLDTRKAEETLSVNQVTQAEKAANLQHYQTAAAANQASTQSMLEKASVAADKFAQGSVDPRSFWNNKSTGDKMQAGLAMLLGGVGSAPGGGPNLAVKTIEDEQNRDLEVQKYNIQHNKEASDVYKGLVTEYRQAGMDLKSAFDAANISIKDKNLDALENMALAHGGEQAKIKLQADLAPLRQNLVKAKADLAKQAADTHLANASAAHMEAETATSGVQNQLTRSAKAADANLAAGVPFNKLPPDQKQAKLQVAQGNKMILGNIGLTTREPTADEQTQHRDLQTVLKLQDQLDKESKGKYWSPEAAATATTLSSLYPKALGTQGRLGEQTQAALQQVIKGGKILPGWEEKARSQALRNSVHAIQGGLYDSLGLTAFDRSQDPRRADAEAAKLGLKKKNG